MPDDMCRWKLGQCSEQIWKNKPRDCQYCVKRWKNRLGVLFYAHASPKIPRWIAKMLPVCPPLWTNWHESFFSAALTSPVLSCLSEGSVPDNDEWNQLDECIRTCRSWGRINFLPALVPGLPDDGLLICPVSSYLISVQDPQLASRGRTRSIRT